MIPPDFEDPCLFDLKEHEGEDAFCLQLGGSGLVDCSVMVAYPFQGWMTVCTVPIGCLACVQAGFYMPPKGRGKAICWASRSRSFSPISIQYWVTKTRYFILMGLVCCEICLGFLRWIPISEKLKISRFNVLLRNCGQIWPVSIVEKPPIRVCQPWSSCAKARAHPPQFLQGTPSFGPHGRPDEK